MLQQDFIIRQVQQLSAVIAEVLLRKRTGALEMAQSTLEAEVDRVFGADVQDVRRLGRDELAALCVPGEPLAGETGPAVAALLAQDHDAEGRRRALWLYEVALEAGEAVPFDVHDRITALQTSLG